MSQITVSNLTFTYDGSYDPIFEDMSFAIDTDWKLGFIGRNGKGKTTFLNLLLGKYEYRGHISSSVEFDYFPFEVEDEWQSTIDVMEAVAPACEQWRLLKELGLLGVDEDVLYRPFGTLSSGEQTKVLLAALFLKENHFLLIDEPTNHLDMEGRRIVAAYLNKKKGFILVSHDRTFLDGCIDHVLSLGRANLEIQQGNYSTWQQNKAYQDQYELSENERLKKDIRRLDAAAKRTASWSDDVEKTKYATRDSGLRPDRGFIGHKSAKMMKRAKSTQARQEKAAEEKSKLLKNIDEAEPLKLSPLSHYQETLIEVRDLAVRYDERVVCEDVAFSLQKGERISLQGKNGCGKSSILKLLMGQEIVHSGSIALASGLQISYVSQDTGGLSGNLSDFAREHNIDESLFKAILRKFGFSRVQFEKEIQNFSGGQKKKVLLAKSLCEQAHVYIWDEPLNFIDVLSRVQIENLILEYQPTMIFVEHDETFVNTVATQVIHISGRP